MTDEAKSKLLARLQDGRARVKKMREDAKAAGQPDPKPRKKRQPKSSDGALTNPSAAQAANETVPPIDGAPRNAVNAVAAQPVDPTMAKSKPIDVPNLPGEGKEVGSKKDIVPNAEAIPEAKGEKGMSKTGKPKKANVNDTLLNKETGNSVIPAQYPGQKESIEKMLKTDEEDKPLAPMAQPDPPKKTVRKVKTHIPDVKAVEGRQPFSMSALRKLLYQ
jgi:hypothetical protein